MDKKKWNHTEPDDKEPCAMNRCPKTDQAAALKVGALRLQRGEKANGWLPVPGAAIRLPITAICGARKGPTVLIAAGVHGAEYIGIQTAMELSRELEAEAVSGNLIILLTANPTACRTFTRFVVPEDGKNLNRVFPGREDGTLSEQIACTMVHELYRQADYFIDLHAGDTSERVMPFVYFPGSAGAEVVEKARAMAMAADVAIRTKSAATTGAYSFAGTQGIPSVLMERGGGGVFTAREVALYKQDVKNILIHLGMIEGTEVHSHKQREVCQATYVEAAQDGLWYPCCQAGDCFEKGALLGKLQNIWGECLDSCYAEYAGIVLYQTVGMGVQTGDPLIAYGKPEGCCG